MTVVMLGSETVTVTGQLIRNSDGSVSQPAASIVVRDCVVAPLTTEERKAAGVDADTLTMRVLLPTTQKLPIDCVVTIGGRGDFTIQGEPEPFIDPDDPELSGYDLTVYREQG